MKKLLCVLFFILSGSVELRSQNPNTAKFPGAVATDQDLFVAKNVARPSVTLTSPVDNATLTLPVTDGTKFRQYQIIGVDLELMQVCSTAALSITACSRGLGGTMPASHLNGAVIGFPFADIQVNQAAAEIKAIESAIIDGPLLVGKTTDDGSGAKLQVNRGISASTATTTGDRVVLTLNAANSLRWKLGLHGDESGSNVGSGLSFWSYDDAGNYLAAPFQLRRTGAVLLNTDTDNGVDKLQVGGSIFGTTFTVGGFTAKGRFGAVETTTPRADMVFNAHPSGANWVRDDDTKSASIITAFDSYTDIYTAAAGTGNIEWILALRVYTTGAVYLPKTPKQINFSLYDPNVALAAPTVPGLWRAALGPATVTAVACMADTADAVIQIKKNTATNVLTSNLTCGNGSWAGAAGISAASLAIGDDLGLQIISGTAKRINVTINYTQQ